MPAYATVADLEAEGYPEDQDARATLAIALASQYIDNVTGQWFDERELTILFDGDGGTLLYTPAPIIDVTTIEIDETEIDEDEYTVYNRTVPDDRKNPKIVFEAGMTIGKQNVSVEGSFGYLEDDETPILIKKACVKIALRDAALMTDSSRGDEITRGRVISEHTDGHSITLAELARSGGPTGDPEIDAILAGYRRPIQMGLA